MYSLEILLSQFWTSLLSHDWFSLLLLYNIQVSQEAGRWSGIPISSRIFHSLLWSTQRLWHSQYLLSTLLKLRKYNSHIYYHLILIVLQHFIFSYGKNKFRKIKSDFSKVSWIAIRTGTRIFWLQKPLHFLLNWSILAQERARN